jgi:DnaJ-class molecular chaperone
MTTTCPECSGAGIVEIVWSGVSPNAADAAECPCCQGAGAISKTQALRYQIGRELRRDRVARGVSLQAEARRLGITPRELSDREWGRT